MLGALRRQFFFTSLFGLRDNRAHSFHDVVRICFLVEGDVFQYEKNFRMDSEGLPLFQQLPRMLVKEMFPIQEVVDQPKVMFERRRVRAAVPAPTNYRL